MVEDEAEEKGEVGDEVLFGFVVKKGVFLLICSIKDDIVKWKKNSEERRLGPKP